MQGKFRKTIEELFAMVQKYEEAPDYALCMKLFEEGGEFAEVLNYQLGFLKHKTDMEPLVEEAADIINTVVGTLAKHYPNKHPRELTLMLLEAVNKKGAKYSMLMGAQDEYFTDYVKEHYSD